MAISPSKGYTSVKENTVDMHITMDLKKCCWLLSWLGYQGDQDSNYCLSIFFFFYKLI